MRNISHGAKCARILQKLGGLIEPGVQLSDKMVQRQAVMLGPVGSQFWRVEFRNGRYLTRSEHFEGRGKYHGEGEVVCDRTEEFDSFEDALSRAVRRMSACLSDEEEAVNYVLSFREWETCALVKAREECESALCKMRAKYAELKEERTKLHTLVNGERLTYNRLQEELRMLRGYINRTGSAKQQALRETKETNKEGKDAQVH